MINIRRLNEADVSAYQTLVIRGVTEHPECFRIAAEDVLAQPAPFTDESEGDFTLGAFTGDQQLIGIVSLRRERQSKFLHKALLYRMLVAREAAGRGAGRALIREAITLARAIPGLERINLMVIASNRTAKALYASEGFVTFSLEKQAVKDGDLYLDEEQMALDLKQ